MCIAINFGMNIYEVMINSLLNDVALLFVIKLFKIFKAL